ncbi:MAG: zeta toxin family protein [Akkermansia sp.]
MIKPRLIILAGPNGSGKSVLSDSLLNHKWGEGCRFLNADEEAQSLGSWNNPECVKQAQKNTIAMVNLAIENKEEIMYETVFSHPSKTELIWKARQQGYFIRFFFVSTRSPIINLRRISDRVTAGGHKVPDDKVFSRYTRSYVNSVMAMRLADRAYFYDNSEDIDPEKEESQIKLLFRTVNGLPKKVHIQESWYPLYDFFLTQFSETYVNCWNNDPSLPVDLDNKKSDS